MTERAHPAPRVHAAQEQDLGLVDVADPRGDALIENHIRDRAVAQSRGALRGELGIEGVAEHVLAERGDGVPVQRRAPVGDLDRARPEPQRDRVGRGDREGQSARRHFRDHPFALGAWIRPVTPIHPEVRTQVRPVGELDHQVLAVRGDRGDALSGEIAHEPLRGHALECLAHQLGAELRRDPVNCIALGHGTPCPAMGTLSTCATCDREAREIASASSRRREHAARHQRPLPGCTLRVHLGTQCEDLRLGQRGRRELDQVGREGEVAGCGERFGA